MDWKTIQFQIMEKHNVRVDDSDITAIFYTVQNAMLEEFDRRIEAQIENGITTALQELGKHYGNEIAKLEEKKIAFRADIETTLTKARDEGRSLIESSVAQYKKASTTGLPELVELTAKAILAEREKEPEKAVCAPKIPTWAYFLMAGTLVNFFLLSLVIKIL